MSEKKGLLGIIFDCIIECFQKQGLGYILIENDSYKKYAPGKIAERWKTFFCDSIYKLSISKKSVDQKTPDRNALASLEKGETKFASGIIKSNYILTFKGDACCLYVNEQKEHLIYLLEGARIIKEEKLLLNDMILPVPDRQKERHMWKILSDFSELKYLFKEKALPLLNNNYEWLYDIADKRLPDITDERSADTFASVMAATMVLSLVVRGHNIPEDDCDRVEGSIRKYIDALFTKEENEGNSGKMIIIPSKGDENGKRDRLLPKEAIGFCKGKLKEFEESDDDDPCNILSIFDVRRYLLYGQSEFYTVLKSEIAQVLERLEREGKENTAKWFDCLILQIHCDIVEFTMRIERLNDQIENERNKEKKSNYLQVRERYIEYLKDNEVELYVLESEKEKVKTRSRSNS